MKIRVGFVSNSSSTSFVITSKSNDEQTLVDFVKENSYLVDKFNQRYNYDYQLEELVSDAEKQNIVFAPREAKVIAFGDEEGTALGHVYDYILRDTGSSKNWKWHWKEWMR